MVVFMYGCNFEVDPLTQTLNRYSHKSLRPKPQSRHPEFENPKRQTAAHLESSNANARTNTPRGLTK